MRSLVNLIYSFNMLSNPGDFEFFNFRMLFSISVVEKGLFKNSSAFLISKAKSSLLSSFISKACVFLKNLKKNSFASGVSVLFFRLRLFRYFQYS